MDKLDFWIEIIKALLPVIIGLVAPFIIRYVNTLNAEAKARLGEVQYALLLSLAEGVVKATEQVLQIEEPEDKKEFAMNLLTELATFYELNITDAQLDALIEAAVLALNAFQASGNSEG